MRWADKGGARGESAGMHGYGWGVGGPSGVGESGIRSIRVRVAVGERGVYGSMG